MTHRLTLQAIEPVTHDTNHLLFDRPDGYEFTPGQATDFALDRDGWREKARPFTFTGLQQADQLEFVVKAYPDHDGVTEQIAGLRPGDTVLIGDPWGAIDDRGPGVFIAGGAGVTPFIGILRNRVAREGSAGGATLIFSNSREKDIILRDEWQGMPGLEPVFTVTGETAAGAYNRRIDGDFLDDVVQDWEQIFYVCGPPEMIDDVVAALSARGVAKERIVKENLD